MQASGKGVSVAVKLALGAMLLVLLSVAASVSIGVWLQTRALEDESQKAGNLLATSLKVMAAGDLLSENIANLGKTAERLRKENPELLKISIIGPKGNMLVDYPPDFRPDGRHTKTFRRDAVYGKEIQQNYGTIVMVFDTSSIEKAVRDAVVTGIILAIVLLAAALALSVIWARHFSRPIVALASAADLIAEGNLTTRLTVPSRDEIGHLTARFNQMAENLEKSRTELERTLNELSALYSVSRIINTTSDLDEVLRLNIETLATGFGFSPIVILLESNHKWRVAAVKRGSEGAVISRKSPEVSPETFGLKSILSADSAARVSTERFPAEWEFEEGGEAFAVPLKSGANLVGVLIAGGKGARESDADKILSVIASQIAPPILISVMIEQRLKKLTNPFEYIAGQLDEEIAKARKFGVGLTIFIFQLRDEAWNEGAAAVERKFSEISSAFRARIPEAELVVRGGANRLLAIAAGYSRLEARAAVMDMDIPHMDHLDIGFVSFPENGESAAELLSRAERTGRA